MRSVCVLWQGWVVLVCLFVASCTKDKKLDKEGDNSWEEHVEICLNISSISGNTTMVVSEDSVHDRVENLTLFIFSKGEDNPEFSEYINFSDFSALKEVDTSRWNEERVIMISFSALLEDMDVERDIHVFVNTEDLLGLSLSELKTKLTPSITEKIRYEEGDYYTMHGVVSNHRFSEQGRAVVNLKRNVARVDLTINTEDFLVEGSEVKFLPEDGNIWMYVENVANKSFLVSGQEKLPEEVGYISYTEEKVLDIDRNEGETSSFTSFYINENMVSEGVDFLEGRITAVVLCVPYCVDGVVYRNNYYRVLIPKDSPYCVRCNTIYVATIGISTLGGETDLTAPILEGKMEVLEWNEQDLSSELPQTYLTIEKTLVNLQRVYNFYYASNVVVNPVVAASGNWLTANVSSENNILLLADDGEFYTEPRSTNFVIEAHNLRKRVTVTQEAVPAGLDGSIKLDRDTLYLYEARREEQVPLSVNPLDSRWKELSGNVNVAGWSSSTGENKGNAILTFEQGSVYANHDFQFLNIESLEYDKVFVGNLFLSGPRDTIRVPAARGTFVEGDITALGGDFTWRVLNTPDWITFTQVNEDNDLVLVADVEENVEKYEREGKITIAHINEAEYVKEITVKQSSGYIPIDESDYLIMNFNYIKPGNPEIFGKFSFSYEVEFVNTGVPELDGIGIGYGNTSRIVYPTGAVANMDSTIVISQANVNENGVLTYSVVVCMERLNNPNRGLYDLLPRYVYIDIYSFWRTTEPANYKKQYPIDLKMSFYKGGGKMVIADGYCVNQGGKEMNVEILEDISIQVTTGSPWEDYRKRASFIATLKYDKV
ncbi:MAG: hypothetical protein LIO65_02305, partial [Odoribacter sp.]|nr:hypothetical protein [Odoribacter sp.]